jgi:hypothetical protein
MVKTNFLFDSKHNASTRNNGGLPTILVPLNGSFSGLLTINLKPMANGNWDRISSKRCSINV